LSPKRYLSNIFTLTEFELRKIFHDSSQIWLRAVQPALWLLVFGSVFSRLSGIDTGGYTYLQFITPGILAQSVMFVAIFYGINVVWERDVGLLNKLLSTPAPYSAIVIGKALSAGVRSIFQVIVILVLALILRVNISLNPLHILGMFILVVLLGTCFSALSMCLAPVFRTRERMMGIGQAIIMPMFFASNAIYPVSLMPGWLQAIVVVNPLSYVVDAFRALLITGDFSNLPIDILALIIATAVFLALASISIKRIIS
jgi:ABC-2 type transport system permease protein